MQSRKSSILKPRKVREPLQDLNQLLPNNDDEETTTTDAQRRRVSFASMNKVKEYETASECVSVISAPPIYDKCYSLSTDVYPPPIPGKNANETYQVANVSRKSIQSTFKASTARRSVAEENIYVEEDVELTETIGRIYDIPMKSSGDSSMEMTHVISPTEEQYDERSERGEEIPLNLTKENLNQIGSSFADAHILEIEIVNKNEKDADTSSMETTEVISNNVIRFENPDSGTLSMETTEVVSNNIIRIEKPDSRLCSMDITEAISSDFDKNTNENNSSMETTEVIYENMLSTSLKSQSAFFETLQSSAAVDDSINQDKDVEYVSVRNFESPNAFPKRKSIFEMSNPPLTNWKSTPMSNINHEKSNCSSSSMKLISGHDSNLVVRNDSLSLTCQDMANRIDDSITNVQILSQEVEQRLNITSEPKLTDDITGEVKFNTGIIKTSTQETNKTKCNVLSMPLLSPEKTKCNNSNMELLTQEDNQSKASHSHIELLTQEDKTKCNNSNMELLTQEDKTKYNNSNMELLTQEGKTKYNNSNMELLTQEDKSKYNNSNMELLTQEDKTKCNNSNMELLTQEENKTKYTNSNMELLSQEDYETKQLLTQEEKIKYLKSAVESILEDTENFDNLNLRAPRAKEKSYRFSTISPAMPDEYETAEKSYVNVKMNNTTTPIRADLSLSKSLNLPKIVPPMVDIFSEFESINEPAEDSLNADLQNSIHIQPTTAVDVNEINDLNNVPQKITSKSSQADDSSVNDSNSPLTVDVNFSIFQKNKETRVEFSGTIDSIKKRKSISNVKVNIINNKTEKSNKHVKELRFSMPATVKHSHEPEAKTEFSATFTDFSIQNEDLSPPLNQKLIAKENIAEQISVACSQPSESSDFKAFSADKVNIDCLQHIESATTNAFNPEKVHVEHLQPTDSTDATVLNSSIVLNGDVLNAQLVKPAKKRLSNDAFNDTEENHVCPKRRSLSNDVEEPNRVTPSVSSPASIESSNSSTSLVRHSITEVKQRKESFVREEKSIVTIDDAVVETCSRSINMNVSYEARQTMSVAHHAESPIQQPSPIHELGSNTMTSGISSSEIDPPCAEAAVANVSNSELSDAESGCRSQSLNQSSSQEEINDYSLHNPSIIVNVGDSFSHYKSMDLGTDNNVSVSEPVVDENKGNPPVIDYIESDGISKENFVVEWLQNKTGKTNVETKLFSSSSDSSSLATVKSATRGTEKSSATVNSDTVQPTEIEGSQLTHLEAMTIDRVESDIKCDVNASEELAEVCNIRTSEEKEEPVSTESQNTNTVLSIAEKSAVSESQAEEMAQINDVPNRIEVTDQNYSKTDSSLPKSSKVKSVEPVFVSSESTSEKRQKMSPEYERDQIETEQIIETYTMLQIKKEAEPVVEESAALIMKKETKSANEKNRMQNQQVMKPRNVFSVASEGHNDNKLTKKPDENPHRHRKFMTTRKDILEKIEAAKNDKQKWKLKVVSEDEWIFQFFFDQLELIIKFDNEESNNICNAIFQYVRPANIKYYEICKIAVEYLIRKNESKLKKICQTVEDIPYLLKLIEPDIIYIDNFVADILKLCDSEIFKIKNGRAVFYVYSFKNIMSAKIQINITRLERLSVKDIHVEEIVGKTDLNLIRSTFCEVGKESDFFSKFVKKLWIILDE